jgi:hypothetical protein
MRRVKTSAATSVVVVVAAVALWAASGRNVLLGEEEKAAGHEGHRVIKPDAVKWEDAKMLPAGAKTAVLEGDPKAKGFVTIRAKLPANYRIPAHWHPCPERVTVLSGTLHLAMGDKFDDTKGDALTVGTYAVMPAGMRHYAWTEGEAELQVSTEGPWGITYVNPADDPRKEAAGAAPAGGGEAKR